MRVLVIGSGGREHAIAWRMAHCPSVGKVYASPGNPGMSEIADCLPATGDYLALADRLNIDLTIIGPEAPLVQGVVDRFRAARKRIIGPTAEAAQLEGSKIYSKQIMQQCGIPTARYAVADDHETALRELGRFAYPLVLKADGLAAGKGVVIVDDRSQAETTLQLLFSGTLVGNAGKRVVIEEFLSGEEISFIALCDGENAQALEPTQDHKAIHDNDSGPNTGGMGAYCDSHLLSAQQTSNVLDTVIYPILHHTRFTGFLYAGLMMTNDGIKVLEFNVRLGDPETQALMHRIAGDFAQTLHAAAERKVNHAPLTWKPDPSVCVVMSAHGYPGQVRTGDAISGLSEAAALGGTVFHAGTTLEASRLLTAGGRVLGVTSSAPELQSAIDKAYAAVSKIKFNGAHFRTDIGRKGLKRW
ncbi:MAG: phosphoribosylamine--glycine ligase, partial [Acidobacteria bacterium]|nr:phosphoribosylamine--glycine ligase [Acidobacteriota bacterium]